MFPVNTRRKNSTKAIIALLVLLCTISTYAQKTRKQLEQEKKDNLYKIAETRKILVETEKEKKATIGQLQALNNQISSQTALIKSMKSEIDLLEEEISDIGIVVLGLETDLINLKQEYAEMIYSAHKANQGFTKLTFLFSAKTFNQLFMRFKYLEQYADARKTQARLIEIVTEELLSQRKEAQTRRTEQETLLAEQVQENEKLLGLKTKQSELVTELSSKEAELKAEVDKRKKSIARLDKLIADMIARETRAATGANVADIADNASFEEMQYRLGWPVATGFISSRFGRQPHPVLENIYVQNSGISIQTNSGEKIRAVSAGTVTRVADVPGLQRVVIVRHGQYLTVYGHLSEVKVSTGQTIARNDQLGTVFTDNDGLSQLEFQVWKGSKKLDPEKWLAKK